MFKQDKSKESKEESKKNFWDKSPKKDEKKEDKGKSDKKDHGCGCC